MNSKGKKIGKTIAAFSFALTMAAAANADNSLVYAAENTAPADNDNGGLQQQDQQQKMSVSLGLAKGYSVFVKGNYTVNGADISSAGKAGNIAVGGNANVPGDYYTGKAVVGGEVTGSFHNGMSDETIDFNKSFEELAASSKAMTEMTPNGTVELGDWHGEIHFKGDDETLNVFTMTVEQYNEMEKADGQLCYIFDVPEGSSCVVNIVGKGDINMAVTAQSKYAGNAISNGTENNKNILFNVPDASNITINNNMGSLMAVNADVTTASNWGGQPHFEGALICNNYNGCNQFGSYSFDDTAVKDHFDNLGGTPVTPPAEEEEEDETLTPGDETPDDQTPDDQTPDDQTPDDQTPDDQTPDDQTPDDQTPDDQTPDDQTPDDQTPDDQTPDDQTPDDQTPDDQTPDDQTPDDQTPDDQTPDDQTPDDQTPDDQTPDDQTPDDQTPDDQTPDDQTPDDQTPDDQTPDDQTPDDQTPDDQTPDDQTPDDQTPDDQTPDDQTPDDQTPDDQTPVTPPTEDNETPETPVTPPPTIEDVETPETPVTPPPTVEDVETPETPVTPPPTVEDVETPETPVTPPPTVEEVETPETPVTPPPTVEDVETPETPVTPLPNNPSFNTQPGTPVAPPVEEAPDDTPVVITPDDLGDIFDTPEETPVETPDYSDIDEIIDELNKPITPIVPITPIENITPETPSVTPEETPELSEETPDVTEETPDEEAPDYYGDEDEDEEDIIEEGKNEIVKQLVPIANIDFLNDMDANVIESDEYAEAANEAFAEGSSEEEFAEASDSLFALNFNEADETVVIISSSAASDDSTDAPEADSASESTFPKTGNASPAGAAAAFGASAIAMFLSATKKKKSK